MRVRAKFVRFECNMVKRPVGMPTIECVERGPGGYKLGSYGQIVREIEATTTGFQSLEFSHEGRRFNDDAHSLARGCIYSNLGRHVWFLSLYKHYGVMMSKRGVLKHVCLRCPERLSQRQNVVVDGGRSRCFCVEAGQQVVMRVLFGARDRHARRPPYLTSAPLVF